MLISVSELLKLEDSVLPLEVEVDLSEVSFSPLAVHFEKPVSVKGKMKNSGGIIMLEAVANGEFKTMCDRCGEEISETIQFEVQENFVKDPLGLEGDSEAIVLENQAFDLTDVLGRAAFSAIPSKHLCRADCKGLCPICGKNLNFETCTCKEDEWDPRFDALRGLFD